MVWAAPHQFLGAGHLAHLAISRILMSDMPIGAALGIATRSAVSAVADDPVLTDDTIAAVASGARSTAGTASHVNGGVGGTGLVAGKDGVGSAGGDAGNGCNGGLGGNGGSGDDGYQSTVAGADGDNGGNGDDSGVQAEQLPNRGAFGITHRCEH